MEFYTPEQWIGKRPTLAQVNNTRWPIDDWQPGPNDMLITYTKDTIMAPVSYALGMKEASFELDSFCLKSKKRYLDGIKPKLFKYINYFEKFYDPDRELILVYANIKAQCDLILKEEYTVDMFKCDIQRYFLTLNPNKPTLLSKMRQLNQEQFNNKLVKPYASTNDALCYDTVHVMTMMEMSTIMDILLPIVAHYAYVSKQTDFNAFLSQIVQMILDLYPTIDIHAKIQETVMTIVSSLAKNDKKLWDTCQIRGIDAITNTCATVSTILLSSFPKYTYNDNPLNYNIAVIKNSIGHQITDISYEYDFIIHDSSKRDGEDNSTPLDRFEMQREKADIGLMIQNQVNCEYTMETIYNKYRRPTVDEVNYYIAQLTKNNQQLQPKDGFQRRMILNLWNAEFGDTASIREITIRDYVALIILAKERLLNANLKIFPYIISGRISKLAAKSFINRKDSVRLEQMEEYQAVQKKYMSPKVMNSVIETIASLLSSEIYIVDPRNEINDIRIPTEQSELIIREYLQYILMI